MAVEKLDKTDFLDDQAGDLTHIRGVSNVALAEATLKQKPKLLTKRMFKVGDIYVPSSNLLSGGENVLVSVANHGRDSFMRSLQ
jgi:hypothetical protein